MQTIISLSDLELKISNLESKTPNPSETPQRVIDVETKIEDIEGHIELLKSDLHRLNLSFARWEKQLTDEKDDMNARKKERLKILEEMLNKLQDNLRINQEDTEDLKNREEQLELLIGKHHEVLIAHNRRMNSLNPQASDSSSDKPTITIIRNGEAKTVDTAEDFIAATRSMNETTSTRNNTIVANNSSTAITTEPPLQLNNSSSQTENTTLLNVAGQTDGTNSEVEDDSPVDGGDQEVSENNNEESLDSATVTTPTSVTDTSKELTSKLNIDSTARPNPLNTSTQSLNDHEKDLQGNPEEIAPQEMNSLETNLNANFKPDTDGAVLNENPIVEEDSDEDVDITSEGNLSEDHEENLSEDSNKNSDQDKVENLEDNSEGNEEGPEENAEGSLEGSEE